MATPDEITMAEAIGRLTEERNLLRQQLEDAQKSVHRYKQADLLWKIGRAFLVAGVLVSLGQGALCIARMPAAPPRCYVQQESLTLQEEKRGLGAAFQLMGHVQFGSDIKHGAFPRLQDAVWAAKELGCPLTPKGQQ